MLTICEYRVKRKIKTLYVCVDNDIGSQVQKSSPIKKRLKEARLKAGLSQKKLGVLSGIDEFVASARMNQYERGARVPAYETLASFAAILSVPVEYFYIAEDDLAEMVTLISRLEHGKRSELLQQLREMLPQDKSDVD